MRYTQSLIKTSKNIPSEETSKSAQLLLRGSYIWKVMAGVYSYLPLGQRVIKNISNIIREEMDKIGSHELSMTALSPQELWLTTDRWDSVDVLFKMDLRSTGQQIALNPTHEEVITPLMKSLIKSYKDLPISAYQIQTKFRNEARAKSGILRGREFLMKDMYSFHMSEDDFKAYYNTVQEAYKRIFNRLGIGDKTLLVQASGGDFSEFSHEYQTLSDAGEDTIYYHKATQKAWNKEIYDTIPDDIKHELEELKAIEVANIFPLNTRFTDAFDMSIQDKNGNKTHVIMGCYGIGISRLMGVLVELLSDNKGIIWPYEIAPYKKIVIAYGDNDTYNTAKTYYNTLLNNNEEVLFDDRKISIGEKLADYELIGIPEAYIFTHKNRDNNVIEVRKRCNNSTVYSDYRYDM